MPKQTTSLPLALPPPPEGAPRGRWLYDALRAAILDGRLTPLTRLPATRDLAAEYGLSRGTVLAAFDRLRAEGYVEARVGDGTYVRRLAPERLAAGPTADDEVRAGTPRLSALARGMRGEFLGSQAGPPRAFRVAVPALDAFPVETWARVASRRLRKGMRALLGNGEILGYRPLRRAIADYLTAMRGVRCAPEQVVVTSGAQEGLDLVARLLLDPGDPVWMEDPGYPGAVGAFRAAGARLLPAPVDARGMDVERAAAELEPARLAYVTPANQFPLGVAMDAGRRLALLRWAAETGAMVLEDDYDGEFRYAGRPIAALQGLDDGGRVIYAGTFGKVLFPALRLGYLVVPDALVDAFAALKSVGTRFGPVLEQAVLADFMDEGHFGRHVRRMRDLYAERGAAFREGARARLGGLLEVGPVEAGMQTLGWLGGGLTAAEARDAALAAGVETVAVGRFVLERRVPEALFLGFASVPPPEIARGVETLARVLGGLAARRREG